MLLCVMALIGVGPTARATDDQVSIEPGTGFSKAQVQQIRALVEDSQIPLRVVAVRKLPKSAAGSADLHAEHLVVVDFPRAAEPGAVLVFSPDSLPEYGGRETTEDNEMGRALEALKYLDAEPTEQFVQLVRMISTRTGTEGLDQALASGWDEMDLPGGKVNRKEVEPSNRIRAARWIVLGGLLLLAAAFILFRGRALAAWWRRRRRTEGLEDTADAALAKNLADQARADVLAFGQAIDAESMDAHDALELWHLALDDHEQASRLLDASSGPADHRKVIEICARGQGRLAKAQR